MSKDKKRASDDFSIFGTASFPVRRVPEDTIFMRLGFVDVSATHPEDGRRFELYQTSNGSLEFESTDKAGDRRRYLLTVQDIVNVLVDVDTKEREVYTDPQVGDVVLVRFHEDSGERKVESLMDQKKYPGGVRLSAPVPKGDVLVHWNVDDLKLVRRAPKKE